MKILDLLLTDQNFVRHVEMSAKPYCANKSFYLPYFNLIAKCISKNSIHEWDKIKSQIEQIFASANYSDLAITERDRTVDKLYDRIGKENDSEIFTWLRKTTYIFTKQIGAELEDVITLYYSTGDELISREDGGNAHFFYSKGLDLSESEWGRTHALTARGHKSIAWFHSQMGNLDDALVSSGRALVSCFKAFGEEHLETAQALNDYACILYNAEDFEDSSKYHQMAARIREKILGENHTDTAISYRNVGSAISAMCNDYAVGLSFLLKALKVFEENYPSGHFEILLTCRCIGECALQNNKDNAILAIEYYEKILLYRDGLRSYEDNFYAEAHFGLGNCYFLMSNLEPVETNFEAALKHSLSAFKSYKVKEELSPEKAEVLGKIMFFCYEKLGNDVSRFTDWLNSSIGND